MLASLCACSQSASQGKRCNYFRPPPPTPQRHARPGPHPQGHETKRIEQTNRTMAHMSKPRAPRWASGRGREPSPNLPKLNYQLSSAVVALVVEETIKSPMATTQLLVQIALVRLHPLSFKSLSFDSAHSRPPRRSRTTRSRARWHARAHAYAAPACTARAKLEVQALHRD